MAKRLKIKVEVEFECPDTCKPEEAFYKYFDANKRVENAVWKLIASSKFTDPSKINVKARAHNEARRILSTILTFVPAPSTIKRGYRSNWNSGASTFEVHVDSNQNSLVCPTRLWFTIRGATFEYQDVRINLANPTSTAEAAQIITCAFGLCSHKDKEKHV